MRAKIFIGLLVFIALTLCLYMFPSASAASPEDEVLQVATNFVKAFNTGDFELISSLHWQSPKLTKFVPNKAGAFLTQGWEAIGGDWKSNLGLPKGTWVISYHNPQVILIGDNAAVVAGYLIMTINPPAEEEQTIIQVRQTLVVQKIGGKWLIVHEHASLFPTE